MPGDVLNPAVLAFDAVAGTFDSRFGCWLSVAAQRRAVRRVLQETLFAGCRILEVGGGTGEDAVWLAGKGYKVTLTDPSPAMLSIARAKLAPSGSDAELVSAEDLESFAARYLQDSTPFDAAFSNFAPLNCVTDLGPVARGLARLIRPGGCAMLVLFGLYSPGDAIIELLRGRPRQALRRLKRQPAAAHIGKHHFTVTYHRGASLRHAMQPWFRVVRRTGIGIFVPPSAAEPWISQHPRLLSILEALDDFAARPFAICGDHILYHFERTRAPAP
jgi:SAM-dependent methyltransferase